MIKTFLQRITVYINSLCAISIFIEFNEFCILIWSRETYSYIILQMSLSIYLLFVSIYALLKQHVNHVAYRVEENAMGFQCRSERKLFNYIYVWLVDTFTLR